MKALDTMSWSTGHGKRHMGIWVCSAEGAFYTGEHSVSRFHHSSFLAGRRVVSGGEWAVENGKVIAVTGKTGHYAASPKNAYNAMLRLQRLLKMVGRDFDDIPILLVVGSKEDEIWTTIGDLIKHRGDASKCATIATPSRWASRLGIR